MSDIEIRLEIMRHNPGATVEELQEMYDWVLSKI